MGDKFLEYQMRQERLYHVLCSGENLKSLQKSMFSEKTEGFVAFIDRYIEEHGLRRQFIIQKALLSPQYGYKILNGQKHTKDRNTILRLCLAMKMQEDDVQQALRYYQMPMLDYYELRDSIILVGINKNHDLYTIQEWLERAGLQPLKE